MHQLPIRSAQSRLIKEGLDSVMYSRKTGMQYGPDFRGGRSARGGDPQCMERCMKQCCNPQPAQWRGQSQDQRAWNYQDPFFGPPSGGGQRTYRPQPFQGRMSEPAYTDPYMRSNPYSPPRGPSYNRYDSLFGNQPGGDQCGDSDGDQVGDFFDFPEDPSCKDWTNASNAVNPFDSGYPESGWSKSNASPLGNNSMRPSSKCPNPQVHQTYTEGCSLTHKNAPMGLFSKFMNMIRPPPPKCPLKPLPSKGPATARSVGSRNSCFRTVGSSNRPEDHFNSLDDLWNPRKIRRWGCVGNWDQHKESLWKQVIENKMGSCGPIGRTVENKVREAIDALHEEGADCIAYRMFYGILKRNEDVYLNPYMQLMTDEEFLKLIVALNNFYFEDKDKRKQFLDHPPPTWIEKIMQKETLAILDPQSRAPSIVRRFWDVLLEWYIHKLVEMGDPSAQCASGKTASQSSFGSF